MVNELENATELCLLVVLNDTPYIADNRSLILTTYFKESFGKDTRFDKIKTMQSHLSEVQKQGAGIQRKTNQQHHS